MICSVAMVLSYNHAGLVLKLTLKKCILEEQPVARCDQDLKQSSQEEVFTNHG